MSQAAAPSKEAESEPANAADAPTTPEAPQAPVLPLRHNRDFRTVFIGQGISALGDAVSYTAVPLLVLALTGSGAMMGLVGLLSQLPDLLLGLPVGALADRLDRRKLMLYADAGRAALVGLIPLSAMLGLDTIAVVLLVTFPINACRVLFMAGWTAAVPNLVGRPQLGRAVSLFEAVLSLSYMIGPALAGVLVGVIGPAQTLAIDAVSFAVSALSLTLVRRPLQSHARTEQHILREIREGVDFIRRHVALRVVVAWWTTFSIVTGGLIVSLTYYVRIDRGLDSTVLGLILSGYGVGNLIGALGAGRLVHQRLAFLTLGGSLVQGLMIYVVSLPVDPLVMALAALVAGIAGGGLFVSYLTFRTSVTPDRLLGRVGSTARTISIGLVPLGVLSAGLLLDQVAGATTLRLIAGGVLLLTVGFALSSTMRHARVQPRFGGAS